MDDFPAGPASPSPRRPTLSVVIPVHDGGRDFGRCLRGLRASLRDVDEVIVVDDASADGSAELAEAAGAQVLRQRSRLGPAAARNAGALAASAPLVFFLDADVEVHPDAVGLALARFEADPNLVGLFGSYDDSPSAPGLVSRFRNLLHHYVHQSGPFVDDARPAHTFWTGCGLIRRSAFLEAGGFDPTLYRRPAIEDIELGYRLARAGHRIVLARDVRATHHKRWTLFEMVRTDVFRRGVPWMLLMKRSRVVETDLNVSNAQRASVAATGLALIGAVGAVWFPWLLAVTILGVGMVVGLNRDFYAFLGRRRGWGFALASVPLHLLYYCCCGASVVIAEGLWLASRPVGAEVAPGLRLDRADGASAPSPPHPSKNRRRSRIR
jgi:GT2 family glycosyltransferase